MYQKVGYSFALGKENHEPCRWSCQTRVVKRDRDPGSPPGRPSLLCTAVATALGAGFVPKAPGTCGTLVAVPLTALLAHLGPVWLWVGTVVVSALGIWAADAYCAATGTDDNQQIVIDEVAGYMVTLLLVPATALNLALGFGLFRLFDIWKPGPVRYLDRNVHGGLGVMADDLMAGVIGAVVLYAMHRLGAPYVDALRHQLGLPVWLAQNIPTFIHA